MCKKSLKSILKTQDKCIIFENSEKIIKHGNSDFILFYKIYHQWLVFCMS